MSALLTSFVMAAAYIAGVGILLGGIRLYVSLNDTYPKAAKILGVAALTLFMWALSYIAAILN